VRGQFVNLERRELLRRKRRILFLCLSLSFLWLAILGRLFHVQLLKHDHYSARAAIQRDTKMVLKPKRGSIVDIHGRVLACSVPTYSVYGIPDEIEEPQRTSVILAQLMGTSAELLSKKLERKSKFVWLSRSPPEDVATRIKESSLPGIYLLPDVRRTYPLDWMSAHLIGAIGTDNGGLTGLEAHFDQQLKGQPGWASFMRDGQGNVLALSGATLRPPRDGHTVQLCVDSDIQCIVACCLREAVERLGARGGCALAMDPRDGRILAAASEPSYSPEAISSADRYALRDYFLQRSYEPGSVFKAVTLACLLDEGRLGDNEVFPNEGEWYDFGGFKIHDTHEFENTDHIHLRDAVAHSSNIVIAKLAGRMSEAVFYARLRDFGFGDVFGLPLPGEASGILRNVRSWSGRSLPTLAIGHEISVTAVQLAAAYGAIANGGFLYRPYLVKAVLDEDGNPIQDWGPMPIRRVINSRTAERLQRLLSLVVSEGTGREAQVAWTTIAGKTGTAQKFDVSTGAYKEEGFLSSFIGFAPATDPSFLCLVIIDEPQGNPYGGKIAAPVFKEILESVGRTRNAPIRPSYRKLFVSQIQPESRD
jgi:cell division protein FtsI (penicillin-binding protein 3)